MNRRNFLSTSVGIASVGIAQTGLAATLGGTSDTQAASIFPVIEPTFKDEVVQYMKSLQDSICAGLEKADGKAVFREDLWERAEGGGGRTRIIQDGGIFEKGGVAFSMVHGELSEKAAKRINTQPSKFLATGVSLVLHPQSPMIPTVHCNYRYFEQYDNAGKPVNAWFGGGADLTPYYPFLEDIHHFHRIHKTLCDAHNSEYYGTFKKQCDEYFTLPHRGETRGVGGIFFDYLKTDLLKTFAFVRSLGDGFLSAYLPIIEKRRSMPFSEAEKRFQLYRRGRYVEFNLVYDRGTTFGLETKGRTESILMSLPPLAAWVYDYSPKPDSREAELYKCLKPRDWLQETKI
jgi:coproporphyrinogen III oxidase